MKFTITLFVADRKQNAFMAHFDLRPDHKWFVELVEVAVTTSTPIDEAHLAKIIEKSKEAREESFWVPAVKFGNLIVVDPGVKILSDGVREMFVQRGGDE